MANGGVPAGKSADDSRPAFDLTRRRFVLQQQTRCRNHGATMVAHLVVHRTSGSTSYETIPPVRLETSGGVLSTVDMVVQRRDGPRRLRDDDDDDDDKGFGR